MTKLQTGKSAETLNMFTDILSRLEMKQMQWSSSLTALMLHNGKSRSQMAELIGCNKSRITRILSGESNPTLSTVYEFSHALGFDFDLVFYSKEHPRPLQLWNSIPTLANDEALIPTIFLEPQSRQDVLSDVLHEQMSDYYLKVSVINSNMRTVVEDVNTFTIESSQTFKPFSISPSVTSNQDYRYESN